MDWWQLNEWFNDGKLHEVEVKLYLEKYHQGPSWSCSKYCLIHTLISQVEIVGFEKCAEMGGNHPTDGAKMICAGGHRKGACFVSF